MAKNVQKKILQARWSCSVQKTAAKNTIYPRKETILKIGHLAKAIDFATWSIWLKNSNGQKRVKKDSTSTLELFCAKNRWKKHHIFEKCDHFENRPSCKGYRLCKMVSLAQKFKWLKLAKKDSTSTLELFCGKKTARKNTKYSRNEIILKIGHLAKGIDFATWWVWLKNSNGQKRVKKDSTSTLELFIAKNRWKKHKIFEKWDHFENRPSCKNYRLGKMVSLGQKFKWPKTCEKIIYKHVRVVLGKKPLEKKPYIREMRPFWKSAILQKLLTLQNGQFGSKIQMAKNVRKKIQQAR